MACTGVNIITWIGVNGARNYLVCCAALGTKYQIRACVVVPDIRPARVNGGSSAEFHRHIDLLYILWGLADIELENHCCIVTISGIGSLVVTIVGANQGCIFCSGGFGPEVPAVNTGATTGRKRSTFNHRVDNVNLSILCGMTAGRRCDTGVVIDHIWRRCFNGYTETLSVVR